MARRRFQERVNILENLRNIEIIERYRFDRDGLLYLHDLLHDELTPATLRNNSLSAMEKLLVTLRFLASGHIQLNNADIHRISQPTASRVIGEVIAAIAHPRIVTQFIQFPVEHARLQAIKREFYEKSHFPNVIGVIDGTHIQIKRPVVEEAAYVNRMGYHSINTQVVFDSRDLIIDMVARWPGSTHDSRILRESGLTRLMEGGALGQDENHLLGDSGYPCKRWLLTPYLNPQPGAQSSYNRAHKATRSSVERGIGQLKARWGILHGEIRLQPLKVCQVILSCGVLHNICKVRHIPLPEEQPIHPMEGNMDRHVINQEGLRYRDYIANTYFQ